MIDLEVLRTKLTLEAAQFKTSAESARGQIAGLSKNAEELSKRLDKVGKSLTKTGQNLTKKVTLPIVALGALAVNQASDLNESTNKVNEVFKENADVILEWSKSSAKSFGLSRAEALETAGTLGNLFKGVGVANDELPVMSQNLVQAAADLGSFNNADPSQVLEDIRSGLVGQSEPLRKYGILLNEAAVAEKAMEMGLADANGELSESAKMQARYALILEGVGDAQGDFARTSGDFANRLRIVKAQSKDLAAQFGEILLPIVTKLVNRISSLADRFSTMSDRTRTIILIVAGLLAALGPLLIVFGQIAIGASRLINLMMSMSKVVKILRVAMMALRTASLATLGPWLLLVAAIAIFAIAYKKNWLGIGDITDKVVRRILDIFSAFRKYFQVVLKDGDYLNDWLTHIPKLLQPVAKFVARIALAFKKMFDAIKSGNIGKFLSGFGDFLAAPAKLIGEFITSIRTGFAPLDALIQNVGRIFIDFGRLLQEIFQGDWRGAFEVGKRLLMRFVEHFYLLGNLLVQAFMSIPWGKLGSALWEGAKAAFGFFINTALPWLALHGASLLQSLLDGMRKFWDDSLWPWIKELPGLFLKGIEKLAEILAPIGKAAIKGLYDTAKLFWTTIAAPWLKDLPNKMLAPFAKVWAGFKAVGAAIINGMAEGIRSVWDKLTGWIDSIINQIERIPDKFKVWSPSKYMKEVGKGIGDGLAIGIRDSIPRIQHTISDVTSAIDGIGAGSSRARFDVSSSMARTAPAMARGGDSFTFADGSIRVDGAGNPEAVAEAVVRRINRSIRRKRAGAAPS